jgi:nucleoside phosphorylase
VIEELFQALMESGANAGPEELAEILWLAARIDGTGISTPDHPDDVHRDGNDPPSSAAESPSAADTSDPLPAEQFYSAADMTDAPGSAVRNVELVRFRRAASLADPLTVMRALRPLGRHAGLPGDADRGELDEELTVRNTIEQGLPVPVMRPRRGRWLDLALVVDTHHSMLLWHDLVTELRRVFVQTGIFRDVRTWYLSGTGPGQAPSVARAGGQPRSVQEVADPAGHRLILIVTDTVADGWNTSSVQDVLRHWSLHSPVALLNVLPRRLWDRGAIRPQPHMVRAPGPAAPNASWRLEHASRSRRRVALAASIAVPIVEASAGSISTMAELVAGGGRWNRLPCLTVPRRPNDPTTPQSIPPITPAEQPAAIEEILRRFRAGASPVAQTLAGYLSAVPLNLPVMNLVRQIMLPESDPGHLAEVALGGLFESWEREALDERTDTERMPFHFRTGVREALLGSQKRHEITEVQELVRREMGAVLTDRGSGPAGDFLAARGTAHGHGSQTMNPDALPFADRPGTPSPIGHPVREVPTLRGEQRVHYIERPMDAQLREAMSRAVNGRSALVLLVGEPGSGKTHSAARAIREMPDTWRLWSPDLSLPLGPGASHVGPRTVVILRDLQTYTRIPGFPIEAMARVVRDLIEDTERAPIMVVGTLTPSAWDNLVDMAQQSPSGDYEGCRHLIAHAEVIRVPPVDATPQRWPGEPSHTRLVMIASTRDPALAGSKFDHLGTGFLLGPRLVLTAARILDRRSQSWTVKVRNKHGRVTADSWVDCRVLWTNDTHDAALLLAEEELTGPATDDLFSAPHWAQLTGDEPPIPCHITRPIFVDTTASQASGHMAGTLDTSPYPEGLCEFEPDAPLPQSVGRNLFLKGLAGTPVLFEDFLLGFVVATRNDDAGRPRLAVARVSPLVHDPGFMDACSQYMPHIPRLVPLPAATGELAHEAEDSAPSSPPAGGDASPNQPTPTATAVVVTALPLEYAAVRSHLRHLEKITLPSGIQMERGHLDGTSWDVAIAETGLNRTALPTQFIVNELRPQVLLFVGLADALKRGVAIGDVVVAETVHMLRSNRSLSNLEITSFQHRTWHGSHQLSQASRSVLRDMSDVRGHFKPLVRTDLAPGDAQSAVADVIRRRLSDACAIELDEYPAYDLPTGQLDALVIRGISDRADGGKRSSDAPREQARAAAHAAQVAVALLHKHQPHDSVRHPIEPASERLPTDVPWDDFNPQEHLRGHYPLRNYTALDTEILTRIRVHFSEHFRAQIVRPIAGINVGVGTDISPALLMLPWCDEITLLENSEENAEYLVSQLNGYDAIWDQVWDILHQEEAYSHLPDARAHFSQVVKIERGNLFNLRSSTERWDIGTLFLGTDPATTPLNFHDFLYGVEGFMRALRPGAPFAAVIMQHPTIQQTDVVDAFEPHAGELSVRRLADSGSPQHQHDAEVLLVYGLRKIQESDAYIY